MGVPMPTLGIIRFARTDSAAKWQDRLFYLPFNFDTMALYLAKESAFWVDL